MTSVIDLTEARSVRTARAVPSSPGLAEVPDIRGGDATITSGRLRGSLVALDLLGALLGWVTVLVIATHGPWPTRMVRGLALGLALSAVMLLLLAAHQLYLARACSIRAHEVARVGRSATLCSLAAFALHEVVGTGPSVAAAFLGGGGSFVVIAYLRGAYARRLRAYRAQGVLCRPVCVLGVNEEAEQLIRHLEDQPEIGYRVVAALGESETWSEHGLTVPAIGYGGDPARTARALGATGIIVAVTAIDTHELDRVVRQLVASGLHVQISTGLTRVGHHRLRMSALSHQLLFYVEPPTFSRWRLALKRTIDILLTVPALFVSAPVLLLAAVAIKLDDGGPVFYNQTRVGQNGQHFQVLKLRTMIPNASSQLAELAASNERSGPLFKLSNDPRVTRVGRLLRATSVDELPQLINVIRGQMSLVGPRPALPSEAAQFDAELLERTLVPAGITGLWQVEARDNASFDAYRRLDLFYVDNWTIMMDLAILCSTVAVVASRAVRALRRGREEIRTAPGHHHSESAPAAAS